MLEISDVEYAIRKPDFALFESVFSHLYLSGFKMLIIRRCYIILFYYMKLSLDVNPSACWFPQRLWPFRYEPCLWDCCVDQSLVILGLQTWVEAWLLLGTGLPTPASALSRQQVERAACTLCLSGWQWRRVSFIPSAAFKQAFKYYLSWNFIYWNFCFFCSVKNFFISDLFPKSCYLIFLILIF